MRYAVILAGGSGVRLWPMSRRSTPKQLIPFLNGKSLLEVSAERLDGLLPLSHQYICASEALRPAVLKAMPQWPEQQFLGEPVGRDTLNAVGYAAAIIAKRDPDAVIAVFTADHTIEPVDLFQRTVDQAYSLVEQHPEALVTFGVVPTGPSTGYGYLELGEALDGTEARIVRQFREKPDASTAREYFRAGWQHYMWNSGMFVWRAATLLECIRRYQPENYAGIEKIAGSWDTPERDTVLAGIYASLKKVSVDYAVMEPASHDEAVRVVALPLRLHWLDVGSWPTFALTRKADENKNAIAADRCILDGTSRTLVASDDPKHLIAVVGCEDLIVIHTKDATLVCRADRAESIKQLHAEVGKRFGEEYV